MHIIVFEARWDVFSSAKSLHFDWLWCHQHNRNREWSIKSWSIWISVRIWLNRWTVHWGSSDCRTVACYRSTSFNNRQNIQSITNWIINIEKKALVKLTPTSFFLAGYLLRWHYITRHSLLLLRSGFLMGYQKNLDGWRMNMT